MIGLSQLLGGRRRKTRRSKSAAPARRKPRRKSRGRGLVGGTIGADPAVLGYYQALAGRGGAKKKSRKKSTRSSRAPARYIYRDEVPTSDLVDPKLLAAYKRLFKEQARITKKQKEEKENEDTIKANLAELKKNEAALTQRNAIDQFLEELRKKKREVKGS